MTGLGVAEEADKPGTDYRPDIDGLRAVAVVSVVLFHARYREFTGGFVGVDIFFVISGFLITRIVRDQAAAGTFSFAKFYVRRMRRLFPALLATVAMTLVAAAVFYAPDLFRLVAASSSAAVLSFANIYFWLNSGYFDPASSLNPLLHTWSLSVEEQFYLIWPMILVVAARRGAALPALLALALASIVGGLAMRNDPSAVFYLMPFRVFELAIGGMMVWVVERAVVPRAVREVALLIAFALIGFAVLTFTEATPFPFNGLVPCFGAAIVILCGNADLLGQVLRNRVSVSIGLISYSLYLIHWPVVVFYQYAVHNELGPIEQAAMVVIALAGGFALNRLVENRFRYARPGSWRPSRFVMASGALAGVVTLVGLHANATGWTWRLGDREAVFLDIEDFYGGSKCTPPRCEMGGGRPLIVMGDSHGRAYFAGMVTHLPTRRLVFFESSGCQFFSLESTRDFGALAAQYDAPCRTTRKQAFNEIRATGGDVVVAQNWRAILMISESTSESMSLPPRDAFTDFIRDELEQLKKTLGVENLVVIGNVPTPGGLISPLDCISRPVRLNEVGCAATSLDNKLLAMRKDFNSKLRESVASIAWFADPYDYLCDQVECANFLNGLPLYTNETHLSELGSSIVVQGMLSNSKSGALTP